MSGWVFEETLKPGRSVPFVGLRTPPLEESLPRVQPKPFSESKQNICLPVRSERLSCCQGTVRLSCSPVPVSNLPMLFPLLRQEDSERHSRRSRRSTSVSTCLFVPVHFDQSNLLSVAEMHTMLMGEAHSFWCDAGDQSRDCDLSLRQFDLTQWEESSECPCVGGI